jgi:hypothetical protein
LRDGFAGERVAQPGGYVGELARVADPLGRVLGGQQDD